MVEIREYCASDWPGTWPILREAIRAGDTYTFSPQSTEEEIRRIWVETPARTFVARDPHGSILGSYFIKANQPGLGAHVCNCGYVVAAAEQGKGIASLMCEHSQAQALAMGFKAMQFNFVVATNVRAIRLWERLGFSVVGRLPGAFNHQRLGYVDALVMFKRLAPGPSLHGVTPTMSEQFADQAPRARGRLAAVFYLLTIVTGALALFVKEPLRSTMLLASTACYIAVTALFYGLFRPVDRNISAVAAAVSLIGCTLSILGFFHLPLPRLNPLVFFGCYCLLIGYLILRSAFLPRILGVLMALGGLGWFTFVSPALSDHLSPYNMAPGVIGEAALTVWLLAVGVNARRWQEQASALRCMR